MVRALCVLATLALLVVAPAARADPPWTAPQPIRYSDTAPPLTGAPSLTTNEKGLAAAFVDAGGVSRNGPHTRVSVFTNGVFLDPYTITGQGLAFGPANGQVAAYANTRLLAAGLHYRSDDRRQAIFAFGRLTPNRASIEEPRALGPGDLRANAPALAVNADGDAAMVYSICRDSSCEHILVYLAVRRAGSSQIHSTRLTDGSGPFPRVAAAVDERGDALAVWSQASTLYARIRTAGGRLRARQRVGPTARGMHLAPSAALSKHRGELVTWIQQAVSEGDTSGGTVWAAKARDGSAFVDTRLSDLAPGTGNYVSEAGTRAAFDAQGRSLVAFTAYDGQHFEVRTGEVTGAAARGDQALADVQTISDPAADAVLADLVVGPGGAEEVLMLTNIHGHDPAPNTNGSDLDAGFRPALATGAFTRERVAAAPDVGVTDPYTVDAGRLGDTGDVLATFAGHSGDVFSRRTAPLP